MIFPDFKLDTVYQVGEKVRINCSGTFLSPDHAAITLVEIEPEAGAGFIPVTSTKLLDWQYSSAGTKVISLRVTAGSPETFTHSLSVVTVASDALWSKDTDLLPYEPDVMKWLPKERSSFAFIHRRAQQSILTTLDERKVWKTETGERFAKGDLVDVQEVKDWSIALALQYLFEGLSNAVGDVFEVKAKKYASMVEQRSNRAAIRIDNNGDGEINQEDENEVRYQFSSRIERA